MLLYFFLWLRIFEKRRVFVKKKSNKKNIFFKYGKNKVISHDQKVVLYNFTSYAEMSQNSVSDENFPQKSDWSTYFNFEAVEIHIDVTIEQ